jgi:hypothetical protein
MKDSGDRGIFAGAVLNWLDLFQETANSNNDYIVLPI